jgi:hypothetical protein
MIPNQHRIAAGSIVEGAALISTTGKKSGTIFQRNGYQGRSVYNLTLPKI